MRYFYRKQTKDTFELLKSGQAEKWSEGFIEIRSLLKQDVNLVIDGEKFHTHVLEKRRQTPELEGFYSTRILPDSGFRFIWWYFPVVKYRTYGAFVKHISKVSKIPEVLVRKSCPDMSQDVIFIYSAAGNYHPQSTPEAPTRKEHSHYEFYDWWQEYLEKNKQLKDSVPYYERVSRIDVNL